VAPAPASALTFTAEPAPAIQSSTIAVPRARHPAVPWTIWLALVWCHPAVPWTIWLALVWFVGIALVLAHLLLGHLSLLWLQCRCTFVRDDEWQVQLDRLRQTLNVRRPVQLLCAPGRTMPMTWGLWRAKLLLPGEADNWSPEQRKDVLLHELGHVRRFDCATQLLAQVACALYWFNPLVWIAWNRVQIERERACDDIVLNAGTIGSTYAQHLLQSAAALPALWFVTPALAMARPSTLESRLRTILDVKRNRAGLSGGATWMTLAAMLIVVVPVALLRAQDNTSSASSAGPAEPAASSVAPAAANTVPATRPAARSSASSGRFGVRGGGGGGFGGGGFGGGSGEAAPALGEGPTVAFGATIYDVRIPADKIGLIDRDALNAAAATPAEFEKALAALGTTKPLYHTDQTVRLSSDTITIGTQTPIVTSSRMDERGRAINSIQYQQTGAVFSIAGQRDDTDRMECDLKIQLSAVAPSSAALAGDVKAPLMRSATMSHKGEVQAKKPFVILSADAASTDENDKAVVYIARVTLGTPQ
jgi:beta-lactamase regulating signal transducer with metallopeptidase domain